MKLLRVLQRGPIVLSILFRFGGVGLWFVFLSLLSGRVSQEDYGLYTYLVSWAIFLATISAVGYTTGIMKWVPRYEARLSRRAKVSVFWSSQRQTMMITFGVVLAAVLMALPFWGQHFALTDPLALVLVSGLCLLIAALDTTAAGLRAIGHVAAGAFYREFFWRLLLLACVYLPMSSLAASSGAAAILFLTLICLAIALLPGLVVLHRETPFDGIVATHRKQIPLLRRVSTFWAIGAISALSNNVDTLIAGFQLSAADVGDYFSLSKVAALINVASAAANMAIAPAIARSVSARDGKLEHEMARTTALSFLMGLALLTALLVGYPLVARAFSVQMAEGRLILCILGASWLFNCYTGAVGFFLSLRGQQRWFVKLLIISYAIGIPAMVLATGIIGALGTAAANALTLCVWNLLAMRRVRNVFGVNFSMSYWLRRRGSFPPAGP